MKIYISFLIILFFAVPSSGQVKDAKLIFGEDRWLAVHYFLQAQVYTENEYDNSLGETYKDAVWSPGFQIRRSRIMLNGQINKNFEFFMSTEDLFIGRNGQGAPYYQTNDYATVNNDEVTGVKDSSGIFTKDAFINYRFFDELEITLGLFPIPFMHQNMESSVSLLGIDYNSIVVPLETSTTGWRDTGIMVRGIAAKSFDYRVGIFRGIKRDLNGTPDAGDDINPDSMPRFSLRLQMNLMDPETGFFYSGNYLGKKSLITFGFGMDLQNHTARIKDKLTYYLGLTADAVIDYKFEKDRVLTVQAAYVNVKNQPGSNLETQSRYLIQAGFLYGKIQPVLRYQFIDYNKYFSLSDPDVALLSTGVNYFFSGHNANVKFEYQLPVADMNKRVSGETKAILQCQIFL